MVRAGEAGGRPRPAEGRDAEAGSGLIVVLDTGGVSGLAPTDERRRARLREVRSVTEDILVPAAVLAEGLLSGHAGRGYSVRQLLQLTKIVDVDEDLGFAAGRLRQLATRSRSGAAPSAVDAIVAAVGDQRAARTEVRIVTSDPDEIMLLASFGEHPGRVSIARI